MKRLRSRRARIIAWISVALVGILVVVTVGVYEAVQIRLSGITHVTRIDARQRPPQYTNALNILLLGSDTRTGHNAAIGGQTGCSCSDTIMIAHISPGHHNITVVSIPRDTVVPLYACTPWKGTPGQPADPYAVERINATLAAGGPECVRETVEQQTGIFINDVMELNFTGFERVINDIGGVNVCLPFAIHNVITATEGSGLDLKSGEHHIDGRVALEFWRTRYNVADGSDIARIARDQYLMAQIVKGVLHSGLLRSPSKIYTVIGDIADAMTTDASNAELFHIATSLRGISAKDVQFITAPWESYPYDPNEVEFAQPQADAVFWAIAHDTAVPPTSKGKSHIRTDAVKGQRSGPIDEGPAGSLLTLVPSQVKVMVLNGSAKADRSAQAAAGADQPRVRCRRHRIRGDRHIPALGHRVREHRRPARRPHPARAGALGHDEARTRAGGGNGRPDPRLRLHQARAAHADLPGVDHLAVQHVRRHQRQRFLPQQRFLRRQRDTAGPDVVLRLLAGPPDPGIHGERGEGASLAVR